MVNQTSGFEPLTFQYPTAGYGLDKINVVFDENVYSFKIKDGEQRVTLTSEIDAKQRGFIGAPNKYGLAPYKEKTSHHLFIRKDQAEQEYPDDLGRPLLYWAPWESGSAAHWVVTIAGAYTPLATSPWDSISSFENLVNLMAKEEDLFATLALVSPEIAKVYKEDLEKAKEHMRKGPWRG